MNYFGNMKKLYKNLNNSNNYYLTMFNFENYLGFHHKITDLHYLIKLTTSEINNLENLNLQELYTIAFNTKNLYMYTNENLELVIKFNPTIISSDEYLSGFKY